MVQRDSKEAPNGQGWRAKRDNAHPKLNLMSSWGEAFLFVFSLLPLDLTVCIYKTKQLYTSYILLSVLLLLVLLLKERFATYTYIYGNAIYNSCGPLLIRVPEHID